MTFFLPALDYTKTTNYYWSQIDIKDVTGVSAADGNALDKVTGPFGFDEAVELGEGRCLTKSEYKVKNGSVLLLLQGLKNLTFST